MKKICHWRSYLNSFLYMLLLTAGSGCGHLFYYPTTAMNVDVQKLEPQPEQVEFKTSDGKKLIGWHFQPATPAKARILFFHGNGQNISSHFVSLYWILKEGYEFMIFDYPGYGGSEGEPTQKSTTDAGEQAIAWMHQL